MSGNRNSSSSSGSRSNSSRSNSRGSHVSCPICSERYGATDKIYGGSCGHVFHWQCLQRWWEESDSCPICRSSGEDYFQLYLNFEELDQSQSQAQSQSQSHSPSSSSRSSGQSSSPSDLTSEYQNLLYESDLYRDEIEYLNARITSLTFCLCDSADSD
ncbi:E3 ubiquitin-protein ligase RNF126 [Drosophila montana]|uniref:E3 ubiquitin-protein ligase RNF126 n=1 Tax=Drosophila montana TaxID=40370 RepID=UPI00313DCA8C